MKIINETIDNLTICKDYYSDIYAKVGAIFHQYLQKTPAPFNEKMEEDSSPNLYSFIDSKNEYNTEEVMHTFDRFFFAFERFPAFNVLAIIPTGEVPSFVKSNDAISPSELYKNLTLQAQED